MTHSKSILIGWAQADITPQKPVFIGGMPWVRVSTGVLDPLTTTVLALEAPYQDDHSEPLLWISCDLRNIPDEIRDGVRAALKESLPTIDSDRIILNATHTHNAPPLASYGMPLEAMEEPEYEAFAIPRIVAAAEQAWKNRRPGAISFGLAHAVIAHNRIMAYASGESKMGSPTKGPDFSHVEGYEDPAAQLLYTWDDQDNLTGVVVNVAATSQVNQHLREISADYWHSAREELRRRLGPDLFVLPQCSAAGDQMSRPQIYARAEERMQELTGRSWREQIAVRIADAVMSILPAMKDHKDSAPVLRHRSEILPLTRRLIGEEDVRSALAQSEKEGAVYEAGLRELEKNPALKEDQEFLRKTSRAYWQKNRGIRVRDRFELQKKEPRFPVELHVIRLGDFAMATNPFELYLDYGIQIKVRSTPVQVFLVELCCGSCGYVPTRRSVEGGAYGAVPASTNVGPEGGKELVDWTVQTINELWPAE